MKKVTLLIPVYNEEAMLPALYQRLIELINRNDTYEWEILFINDGSSDQTLDVIRQLRQTDNRVNFVNLSRNFGKEIAMLAGFDYTTGDCCVIMDADLQDPPELVDRMLQYWEEGYDDIYAKRRSRGEESWLRRRLSLAFYKILQNMSRYSSTDISSTPSTPIAFAISLYFSPVHSALYSITIGSIIAHATPCGVS